jgi:hypothetical protein
VISEFFEESELQTLLQALVSAHVQTANNEVVRLNSPRSKYGEGNIHNIYMDVALDEFCKTSKKYSLGLINNRYPFLYAESLDSIIQLRRSRGKLSVFPKPSAFFNQARYNEGKQGQMELKTQVGRLNFINTGKLFGCLVHHVGKDIQGLYLKKPHPILNRWEDISENILEYQPKPKYYSSEQPATKAPLELKNAVQPKEIDGRTET